MIISYHGKQFFKIQQGDTVYALNPLGKDNSLGIKPTKFGSDVAMCSVRTPNYNGFENTEYNNKQPFQIFGPGAYEINGNMINGFATDALIDDQKMVNTVYFFNLEGISFCMIGDLANINIDQKVKEFRDTVDVIFVPIGGNGTLDPVEANKIIKIFSPKVIIPMDYGSDREPKALETFLKENSSDAQPEPKFVFKKSDIDAMSGRVIVLDIV
jgi:hypothetical protein